MLQDTRIHQNPEVTASFQLGYDKNLQNARSEINKLRARVEDSHQPVKLNQKILANIRERSLACARAAEMFIPDTLQRVDLEDTSQKVNPEILDEQPIIHCIGRGYRHYEVGKGCEDAYCIRKKDGFKAAVSMDGVSGSKLSGFNQLLVEKYSESVFRLLSQNKKSLLDTEFRAAAHAELFIDAYRVLSDLDIPPVGTPIPESSSTAIEIRRDHPLFSTVRLSLQTPYETTQLGIDDSFTIFGDTVYEAALSLDQYSLQNTIPRLRNRPPLFADMLNEWHRDNASKIKPEKLQKHYKFLKRISELADSAQNKHELLSSLYNQFPNLRENLNIDSELFETGQQKSKEALEKNATEGVINFIRDIEATFFNIHFYCSTKTLFQQQIQTGCASDGLKDLDLKNEEITVMPQEPVKLPLKILTKLSPEKAGKLIELWNLTILQIQNSAATERPSQAEQKLQQEFQICVKEYRNRMHPVNDDLNIIIF